jgi:hypothetical protein
MALEMPKDKRPHIGMSAYRGRPPCVTVVGRLRISSRACGRLARFGRAAW